MGSDQNLKDWFSQYSKSKQLDTELANNIDEASEELITQDQIITKLRTENSQLKRTNQSLQKDLDLAQRLGQSRKTPFPTAPLNSPWMPSALSFLLIGTILWLTIR
jgi:transposase-like protein